ncbi:MAG: hypothetical protein GY832_00490 [Chloroflexi bacterium]|nr:hypothetical protein [Chloroflexota bacterium]
MNTKSKLSLWTNNGQTKYYLIPPDQLLPDGDFTIRTSTGQEQAVDATAAAIFEITKEQAEQHIQSQMDQALEGVKDVLGDFMGMMQQEAKQRAATQAEPPLRVTPGLVTDLIGFTADELRAKPEILEERVNDFFGGIKTFLQSVTSENPAELEPARDQMRSLRATFEKHGVETNEAMEQLPDKMRTAYLSADREESLKSSAAELEKLAELITQTAASASQQLQASADDLQSHAEQIHTSEE